MDKVNGKKAEADQIRKQVRTAGGFLREYKWIIIACGWITAFFFGFTGFAMALGPDASSARLAYLTIQLFVLESGDVVKSDVNIFLEIARFLAPITAGATALVALAFIFFEQFQLIGIHSRPGHVVICGLGRIGHNLARFYNDQHMKVVVIEKDSDNDYVNPLRMDGVIVIFGDAIDRDTLNRAKIQSAKYLVAGTGDDGLNAEVAWQAKEIMETVDRKEPLVCFVHMEGTNFFNLLKKHPVMTESRTSSFELCPFNIHQKGAQLLLDEHTPREWDDPDFDPDHPSPLVILGFGRFGKAVAVEAIRRWDKKFPGKKLYIEVFDRKAVLRERELQRRYPGINDICNFRFVDCDFEEVTFGRDVVFPDEGEVTCSNIYICVGDDRLGLNVALILYPELGEGSSMIVRTDQEMGLTRLIQEAGKGEYSKLHAFELLEKTCKPDQIHCFMDF